LPGDGRVAALETFQYVAPWVRAHTCERFQFEQQPVLEVRGMSGEIIPAQRP